MDLVSTWKEQQSAMFPPELLGRAVDGTALLRIDAVAGAALTASLRQDGIPRPLPAGRRAELEAQLPLIEAALADPALAGEGRRYFERLRLLSQAVLKA